MSRWDEETGCEILTPAERSRLEKEIAAFAAKKEKARAWATRLMLAKSRELGIALEFEHVARIVWRSVWRELEAKYMNPETGQSPQALAFCMFAPVEFVGVNPA